MHVDGESDEGITGINVTPLVDVVLVLLIILLVAGAYAVSRSIPMDLPGSGAGAPDAASLVVAIDADGATRVDGEAVTRDALKPAVRRFAEEHPDGRAVIAAEAAAAHGAVVSVVDLLRREGVSRLAFSAPPRP